jgi:hypothetical protein
MYISNRKKRGGNLLVLTAPLVHLAAIFPTVVMKFLTSGLLVRVTLIALPMLLGSILINDDLHSKLLFYIEFEGFRSLQDIYASWIKRIVIISVAFALTVTNGLYWGLYSIGLAFAAAEFIIPEFAVRIGAYFEQFEVFLVAGRIKQRYQTLGYAWYSLVAILYTTRFMVNINSIPR